MNIAKCQINGEWKIVEMERDIIGGLVEEKDISDIRCMYCNASAHIVHDESREWHFRAHHEPNCDIVKDGREHKSHKVTDNTIIDDVETIFHHKDHAPTKTSITKEPKPDTHDNPPDPHPELDEIDSVISYGSRIIHTVGGLYNYVCENGLDADLANGITGRELFLNARALREVRRNGMCGMRIAITKRFSPSLLKYPFKIPLGYICLCDAFATDIENAVFFVIKLKHAEQNRLFQSKIFGDKNDVSVKDKHRNILILGNWNEYPDDYYNIFISDEINSRCIKFINFKEFV